MYKEKAIEILDGLLNDGEVHLSQLQRYALSFAINKGLLSLPDTTPAPKVGG